MRHLPSNFSESLGNRQYFSFKTETAKNQKVSARKLVWKGLEIMKKLREKKIFEVSFT